MFDYRYLSFEPKSLEVSLSVPMRLRTNDPHDPRSNQRLGNVVDTFWLVTFLLLARFILLQFRFPFKPNLQVICR